MSAINPQQRAKAIQNMNYAVIRLNLARVSQGLKVVGGEVSGGVAMSVEQETTIEEIDQVVNGNVADDVNQLVSVLSTANMQFGKAMSRALHASIGVACALSLKERNNCLVLILEGPPGIGKSEAVRSSNFAVRQPKRS